MNYLILTGGVLLIILGFSLIIYVIKKPIPKEEDTNMHNLQGVLSGLGLIAFGIVIIYRQFYK